MQHGAGPLLLLDVPRQQLPASFGLAHPQVMLAKILRNAALPIPREMNLGGEGKPESATSAPQPSPVQSRQSAAVPVAAAVSEPPLGGKDSGLALAHDLRQLEKTVVEMRLRLDSLQASTAETAVDSQAVPATLPVKTVEDHQAPETTRGISELERKIEGLAGRMDALSAAANSEKSGRAMDDSSSKPGNGASELKTGLREAGARAKNLGTAVDPGEEIARLKAELNEQAKVGHLRGQDDICRLFAGLSLVRLMSRRRCTAGDSRSWRRSWRRKGKPGTNWRSKCNRWRRRQRLRLNGRNRAVPVP